MHFLEEAGDAAALLYANPEAISHYRHALELLGSEDDAAAARIGEKQGDVALRLGRVDAAIQVWGECLDHHRREEDLDRVADLHRKLGAALAVKGERKAAIENYQRGINLLKDGPPRLELVRLYEEAAWLYLQTGDNMLAIYASEKALRLAERLGETRAASRAHGIFGRVFGRIGDTEKARSNLERSVELARALQREAASREATTARRSSPCSPSAATSRSRRPTPAAPARPTTRRWRWPSRWATCRARSSCTPPSRSWPPTAPTGSRCAGPPTPSADLAEREGLVSKLCLPYALRGLLRWREGSLDRAEERFRARPRAGRAGGLVGAVLPGALRARADPARPRRARRRRDRAGPGDRRVRARRPGGPVGAGHGHPGGGAGAGRARPAGARVGRRGRGPGGAAALPDRQGGGAGGAAAPATRTRPTGASLLVEAEDAWTELERPLEAARCRLLAGFRLQGLRPGSAQRSCWQSSAELCERLGVAHLAEKAARSWCRPERLTTV